jgi:hypothetical protein
MKDLVLNKNLAKEEKRIKSDVGLLLNRVSHKQWKKYGVSSYTLQNYTYHYSHSKSILTFCLRLYLQNNIREIWGETIIKLELDKILNN